MSGWVERLAQAETRTTFERLLHSRSLSLTETYELSLEDLVHQPAELATLAKRTLRKIMDADGPVSVNELASALAPELTAVASARALGRDLTDTEITEAFRASCKGFVCASQLNRPETWLHIVHISARDFLKTRGIPE
jgi:hypothetical protein